MTPPVDLPALRAEAARLLEQLSEHQDHSRKQKKPCPGCRAEFHLRDRGAEFVRGLLAALDQQQAVLGNPQKWMQWCDSKILERAEAAEQTITTLRADRDEQARMLAESRATLTEEIERLMDEKDALRAELAHAQRSLTPGSGEAE